MITRNEIQTFKILPTTITQISKDFHISASAAFKITDKLIKNGLATKQRQRKNVLITRENTSHAQKLEEIPLY